MAKFDEVSQAHAAEGAELRKRTGAVGSYVGFKEKNGKLTEELAIVVRVEEKLSPLQVRELVPREVGGVRTDVQGGGKIRALPGGGPATQEETRPHRPAPAGVSVGHKDITAGTIALNLFRTTEADGRYPVSLSNNHVYANSNEGAIGSWIHQPGPYDGGLEIAPLLNLHDFVPIHFGGGGGGGGSDFFSCIINCLLSGGDILGCIINCLLGGLADTPNEQDFARRSLDLLKRGEIGDLQRKQIGDLLRAHYVGQGSSSQQASENYVDAALGTPINMSEGALIFGEILKIGKVSASLYDAQLGDLVEKHGRTTEFQLGRVTGLEGVFDVSYGSGKVARFVDQVVVRHRSGGEFSAGGDSGSLVVTSENKHPTALLFAGGGGDTICNRIQRVWEAWPGLEIPA